MGSLRLTSTTLFCDGDNTNCYTEVILRNQCFDNEVRDKSETKSLLLLLLFVCLFVCLFACLIWWQTSLSWSPDLKLFYGYIIGASLSEPHIAGMHVNVYLWPYKFLISAFNKHWMHVHMYLNESEGLLSDCSTGVKETTRAKIAQIEYGCRMYSNLRLLLLWVWWLCMWQGRWQVTNSKMLDGRVLFR